MTLTPIAELLAVELSIPVFMTHVCRDRGSNLDLRMRALVFGRTIILICATKYLQNSISNKHQIKNQITLLFHLLMKNGSMHSICLELRMLIAPFLSLMTNIFVLDLSV